MNRRELLKGAIRGLAVAIVPVVLSFKEDKGVVVLGEIEAISIAGQDALDLEDVYIDFSDGFFELGTAPQAQYYVNGDESDHKDTFVFGPNEGV